MQIKHKREIRCAIIQMGIICMIALCAASFMPPQAHAKSSQQRVSVSIEMTSDHQEQIAVGDRARRCYLVSSDADSCYVRLKSTVSNDSGISECKFETHPGEGWVHTLDGYWYYMQPIAEGQSCAFESELVLDDLSKFMGSRSASKDIDLTEVAEVQAIQAEGLAVDWASNEPWGPIQADAGFDQDSFVSTSGSASLQDSHSQGAFEGSWSGHGLLATDGRQAISKLGGMLAQTGDLNGATLAFACIALVASIALGSFSLFRMRKANTDSRLLVKALGGPSRGGGLEIDA